MNYRPLRVGKLIREELSALILRELEFPGALVTLMEVEVDKKLGLAKVEVSVVPSARAGEALAILNDNRSRLQHALLRKINIKPMPQLRFAIDRGPENAARVEKNLLEEDNT